LEEKVMKQSIAKYITTTLGVASFAALATLASAQASLPLVEHFAYPDGNLVGNTINGGTWTQTSGQTASPVQVSAGSLIYGTLPNVSGGKVTLLNGSSFDDPFLDITPTTAGSIYASFILNVVNPGNTTGDYFFALTTPTNTQVGRVYVRQGSSSSNFQLGAGFGATPSTWSSDFPVNTPVFVVVSYDFVPGASNDTVRLWVNPQLGLPSPPTPTLTATPGTEQSSIGRILLRQGSGNTALNLQLDELRVDTSWTSVTPNNASVQDWSLY
jgi:hypothetical protein